MLLTGRMCSYKKLKHPCFGSAERIRQVLEKTHIFATHSECLMYSHNHSMVVQPQRAWVHGVVAHAAAWNREVLCKVRKEIPISVRFSAQCRFNSIRISVYPDILMRHFPDLCPIALFLEKSPRPVFREEGRVSGKIRVGEHGHLYHIARHLSSK